MVKSKSLLIKYNNGRKGNESKRLRMVKFQPKSASHFLEGYLLHPVALTLLSLAVLKLLPSYIPVQDIDMANILLSYLLMLLALPRLPSHPRTSFFT